LPRIGNLVVGKNPAMTAKSTENEKKCDKQARDASKNGKLAKRLAELQSPLSLWENPAIFGLQTKALKAVGLSR